MIFPCYIYYTLQLLNWFDDLPLLKKASVYAVIITLGLLVWWAPAHAATPDQIGAVITKVQEKTVEATGILADPKDGTLYKVGVRYMLIPSCGHGVSVSVDTISILTIDSGGKVANLTSINVMTPYDTAGGALMLMDLDGNGTVDRVAPMGAIPNEEAQPIFDEIIACITRIR